MNTSSPLAVHHASNERIAVTIAHAGTVVAWFLAPLVVYLVLPREARWARSQALQSLLWSLLGTIVSLATCGLAIPFFLAWHVYAAIKSLTGEEYDYPVVADTARRTVYS
jgi:uncharacterized protein